MRSVSVVHKRPRKNSSSPSAPSTAPHTSVVRIGACVSARPNWPAFCCEAFAPRVLSSSSNVGSAICRAIHDDATKRTGAEKSVDSVAETPGKRAKPRPSRRRFSTRSAKPTPTTSVVIWHVSRKVWSETRAFVSSETTRLPSGTRPTNSPNHKAIARPRRTISPRGTGGEAAGGIAPTRGPSAGARCRICRAS